MDSEPRKTILLVEDEPLIAMAEKMTLERNGYSVITANTGEKAIQIALENQEIDLVLMDIDLGSGMSGTEAAEAILDQRSLPLAFLSSHTEPEVVKKTEGITSYGYIVKNSGDTVLLASIRMAFKLHDAHAELLRRKDHLDRALAREEHMNERLIEKSEELEQYFAASLDMLCIANTDGEFLRLNPEWENILGYPLEDLEGRSFMELVHPDDRDATLQAIAELKNQNEILSFENRYRCVDGSYRWIEWRSRPKGSTIYAVARNITDRKNAENELKAQASLQHLLMTIASELIDVPRDEVDDRINWVLAEMGRFNGFDRVFVFHNDFDRAITINTHEWCAPGIKSEIENLQAIPLENLFDIMETHKNGTAYVVSRVTDLPMDDPVRKLLEAQNIKSTLLFPLMQDGVNIGFIGFDAVREERHVSGPVIDLLRFTARFISNTETRRTADRKQHKAERVIRESEERFRGLLDGIREVPVQGFGPDGTIQYWNLASEKLYGYRAEEAIGKNILDLLIPPEIRPTVSERIRQMAETGEPIPATEDWIACSDGTQRLVRTTHAVVQLPGREKEFFSIDHDVTEQRRAEEQVHRLVQEKEMLIKEVQHRIKNSMNTMGSLLSLHAQTVLDPSAVAALNDARSRFTSMEVLYDHLYRADAHTSGSVKQYLVQLIDRAVHLFPVVHTVTMTTDIEDFTLDAKRLSSLGMIVNELVTNAMKYAFRENPEPELQVQGRVEGDRYILIVADNGPGIPESFDSATSSSFGISMVGALTDQLRGTIRFQRNGGTEVILEFPRGVKR